jgi:hypothetical protein
MVTVRNVERSGTLNGMQRSYKTNGLKRLQNHVHDNLYRLNLKKIIKKINVDFLVVPRVTTFTCKGIPL